MITFAVTNTDVVTNMFAEDILIVAETSMFAATNMSVIISMLPIGVLSAARLHIETVTRLLILTVQTLCIVTNNIPSHFLNYLPILQKIWFTNYLPY